MFTSFLIGTLLLTCLTMVILLIMPNKERAPRSAPIMGIALFMFLAALAVFGAFSVTA